MCCDFNIIWPSFEGKTVFSADLMKVIRHFALCIVVG